MAGALRISGRPRGFTILELLTVIGIIALLAAILLPALGSAREAARRVTCVNHLKQIGVALHCYHEVCRSFPPGWQWETHRNSAYGWAVPLLPYLEQQPLYEHTDRNAELQSPANTLARTTSLPALLCPSDITDTTFLLVSEEDLTASAEVLPSLPTANYFGVFGTSEPDEPPEWSASGGEGSFIESRPVRLYELLRGASNTMLVGERTMARIPSTWLGVDRRGADAACRLTGNALIRPNCDACDECEFDSRHPGGANFLWGDGRVSTVSDAVDSQVYQQTACRSLP